MGENRPARAHKKSAGGRIFGLRTHQIKRRSRRTGGAAAYSLAFLVALLTTMPRLLLLLARLLAAATLLLAGLLSWPRVALLLLVRFLIGILVRHSLLL